MQTAVLAVDEFFKCFCFKNRQYLVWSAATCHRYRSADTSAHSANLSDSRSQVAPDSVMFLCETQIAKIEHPGEDHQGNAQFGFMIPIRFISATCCSPNSKLWWWLRRAVYHCVLKQVRLSMIWAHFEALRPCLRAIAHVQLMLSMMKANMRPFV
jgi:hypothetical protein